MTNDEASRLQFELLASLTPEQADQYAHDLALYGKSAIKREADGSVRVLSPCELNCSLKETQEKE